MNFIETFRKEMTFDNIKSHRKPGLHPLSRRCSFGKTAEGDQIDPAPQPFKGCSIMYLKKFL